jgi:two-component system sensor histidine kinase BaeS
MTRRLVLVIVAAVAATLLVVGGMTLGFARLRARANTEADLRELAGSISEALARSSDTAAPRPALVTALRRVLRLDEIELVTITRNGRIVGRLPPGVAADHLDPQALLAGEVRSGRSGSLVWVAAPTTVRERTVATVVTREADAGLADAMPVFLLASGITLALGTVAAVAVGRRLARPVRQADRAARQIAAGQLDARVPEPPASGGDELADLARSINSMADSLERSRGLERQFLLSVSHDLRTPLTSIRGYAEAIAEGAAPDVRQAAGVITREARRLERLVSDLLDLARLDARSFSLTSVEADLGALAAAAVRAFEPDAVRRGLQVTFQPPPEAVTVWVDPDRLSQVLSNLLENAGKFAKSSVRVDVRASRDRADVVVDDDGPGIAPADLPHVFERLYVARHRPAGSESGSGLGLAIVRQLTVLMGGTVTAATPAAATAATPAAATAATASGTRMTVSLPRRPAAAPPSPATPT